MMQLCDATADTTPVSSQAQTTNAKRTVDLEVAYLDPLDPDLPSDPQVTLSHRQLGRLIFIAADTGARFVREDVDADPVGWLFAPRILFNGRQAVVACRQREPFVRAMVLHGLSLGLDADLKVIDGLFADDGDQEFGRVAERDLPLEPFSAIG